MDDKILNKAKHEQEAKNQAMKAQVILIIIINSFIFYRLVLELHDQKT